MVRQTLSKKERLCSKTLIDLLFTGKDNHSVSAFPIRMIYRLTEEAPVGGGAPVQILISVPKRYFHLAVDRNRVKRQIREAYRRNKYLLDTKQQLLIAFIWVDSKHYASGEVEKKVVRLLTKIKEDGALYK